MREGAGGLRRGAVAALLSGLACARAAAAAEAPAIAPTDAAPVAAAPGTAAGESSVAIALGVVQFVDPDPRGMVSFEYRYAAGRYRPSPWLAAEATGNDRFFGFGGFLDIPLGNRLVLTPALGGAIYLEHDGIGLDWHLEFRSSLELTWQVGATRLGAAIAHYSNLNLGEHNPGTEVMRVVWVVPFGKR